MGDDIRVRDRHDGRLLRYGVAAIALGAWVTYAPVQATAWADTPDSASTSETRDAGPKADAAEKAEEPDKADAETSTSDDDATDSEPPAEGEVSGEPEEIEPGEEEVAPEPEPVADEPVEPVDPGNPQPTEEPATPEIVVEQPAPTDERESTRHEPLVAAEETSEDTAAVLTLRPTKTRELTPPSASPPATVATALATVETPSPVEKTTPTPPQPLSPVAELLELPGRVVNAVLQVLGFTTAANVPVSPITLAPLNDLVFGAFREIERHLGLWQDPGPLPAVPTMTYTGDTDRPTPTVAQLLNASAAGYVLGSTPGGLKPLTVNGFQMQSTNVFSGIVGKAWVTPEGQVIIAYQGTTGGSNLLFNPLITISQIVADLQVVFTGTTPMAFHDALDFAERVQAEAALQGYSDDDIFVTGHSLGGWEAQYVSQQMGFAGIGFEAPGINTVVPGNGADSMFVNVGTYGSTAPYMATDLFGLQPFMPPFVPGGGVKPHYGPIVMIGDPANMTPLYNASQLWGRGPIGSAVFLVDFLMNFFQYHLPGVQAYHLDVTPDPGIVLWLGTARGPVHTGYGALTIPELMQAASDDGILFLP